MKIATVQFNPNIGELKANVERADSLLKASDLEDVQLLVGPELAFTGYNFPSLQAIAEFLEPTCGGPTAWWAAKTAKRHGLIVSIGYPEITKDPEEIPEQVSESISTLDAAIDSARDYVARVRAQASSTSAYWTFNSTLTVGPDGRILAHYRKTHLYYTDVTWASPSIEGFTKAVIPFSTGPSIKTSFAICMDLNPKAFTASWQVYEVANYVISNQSSLLVVSTAWMTREDATAANDVSSCCPARIAQTPDMDAFLYWIERLSPLIEEDRETIVVIANRVGNEEGIVKACDLENLIKPVFQSDLETIRGINISIDGLKHQYKENPSLHEHGLPERIAGSANIDEQARPGTVSTSAHYAGSSTILKLGNGVASIYGVLGRGVEDVLVGDTDGEAIMKFRLNREEEQDS